MILIKYELFAQEASLELETGCELSLRLLHFRKLPVKLRKSSIDIVFGIFFNSSFLHTKSI